MEVEEGVEDVGDNVEDDDAVDDIGVWVEVDDKVPLHVSLV